MSTTHSPARRVEGPADAGAFWQGRSRRDWMLRALTTACAVETSAKLLARSASLVAAARRECGRARSIRTTAVAVRGTRGCPRSQSPPRGGERQVPL